MWHCGSLWVMWPVGCTGGGACETADCVCTYLEQHLGGFELVIGPILPNPDPRRQKVDKLVVLVSDPCLEEAWAVAVMFEPDGSTVATIKHKTNEAAAREPVGDHDPATVVAVPDQPSRFTLTHHQNPKSSVQSESGCDPVNPCRQVHTDEGRLVVHQVNARLNRGSVIGQSIAHGSDGPGRRVRRAPRPHG